MDDIEGKMPPRRRKRKSSSRRKKPMKGGNTVKVRGGPITLQVGNVGHITIFYVKQNATMSIPCHTALREYFKTIAQPRPGVEGNYILKFSEMWGRNSAKVANDTKLAALQETIFNNVGYVQQCANESFIDTSRYTTGLPLAHIDIQGDPAVFAQYSSTGKKEAVTVDYSALNTV